MQSIHDIIKGTGPVDDQEARALAAAACEGIIDPITHDHLVGELKTALVMIEPECIMGGDGAVRNYARELLKKIEAAAASS